jgi:hypothetical protein
MVFLTLLSRFHNGVQHSDRHHFHIISAWRSGFSLKERDLNNSSCHRWLRVRQNRAPGHPQQKRRAGTIAAKLTSSPGSGKTSGGRFCDELVSLCCFFVSALL